MPVNLDLCIAGVFTPGNIGASSGQTPVAPVMPSREPGVVVAAIVEAAIATDTLDATKTAVIAAAIVEAATAADTPDATVPVSYVTWDAATVAAVTLSGGNLVATNTGTTSANQGAHVVSTSGKSTGKYYFEGTFTTVIGTIGTSVNVGFGIGTTASTFTNMGNGGTTGIIFYKSRAVWSNGAAVINGTTQVASGQVLGIAVDLTNRKVWFKRLSIADWNENPANDPATNVGGYTLPAGTMVPFVTFGGTAGVSGLVMTANFGASAFAGTVPSGFTSGWTV